MVATRMRIRSARTKIRPFNPLRDAPAVTDLIELAFGDSLGADGALALAEMQRMARWGFLTGLFYWLNGDWASGPPGFVWIEDGAVVGNVSLRPGSEYDSFFIGNLAVHPDYRRRGIGRALMETALETVEGLRWGWIGLEVREENVAARRLYESLNFRSVGRTLHLLRQPGPPGHEESLVHPMLRRAEGRDGLALLQLVRAVTPVQQRPILGLRKSDYRVGWGRTLDCWLFGRREAWWVVEEISGVKGAVRALRERGRRPNRLEILVAPGWEGTLGELLIRQALAGMPRLCEKMISVELALPASPIVTALENEGFQSTRILIQMRYN